MEQGPKAGPMTRIDTNENSVMIQTYGDDIYTFTPRKSTWILYVNGVLGNQGKWTTEQKQMDYQDLSLFAQDKIKAIAERVWGQRQEERFKAEIRQPLKRTS